MVKATEEVSPSAGPDASSSLQGISSQEPAPAVTGTTTAAPYTGAAPVTRPGYAHLFKYIVVGDAGSGKTSVVRRFCSNTFTETQIMTSGVDFDIKTLSTPNGDQIKLQIWDTAGQERFRTITSSYYRGAHGIIIVYDVTDKATYDNVFSWMKEVQRYCNESAKFIIVGNKMDLWDGKAEMYGKEKFAEAFGLDDPDNAESWTSCGISSFHQASAKTGEGVARAFQDLTDALVAERLDVKNPLRAAGLRGRAGGTGGTGRRKSSGGTSSSEQHDGYHTQINYRKRVRVKSTGGCCTVL